MSDLRIFYKDISCRTNSFSKLLTSLNILDTTQTGPGFCWLLQFLFSLSSFSTPRYSWESGQNLKVDYWLWILIENIGHFFHFCLLILFGRYYYSSRRPFHQSPFPSHTMSLFSRNDIIRKESIQKTKWKFLKVFAIKRPTMQTM